MRCGASSALLGLFLTASVAHAQTTDWIEYVVPETGAIAQIPKAIFSEDGGRPDDGYGKRFETPDKRANLTVQSVSNDAGYSPSEFLAKKRPPPGVVYKRITPRFFVVSSVRGDTIWYDRCNFVGRNVNCVLINYPAAEKRQWDGVVTRISNTLASR
jgi:hypothetical protein